MKIHLNSKAGIYEVETYGRNTITVSTKHNIFQVPVSDFKTFAGGIWNNRIDPHEFAVFLSVVRPDEYKLQVEQEDQIMTLAARLDIIQAKVKAEEQQVPVISAEEEEGNISDEDQLDREHQEWLREYEQEKNNRTVIEWESMLTQKDADLEKKDKKLRNIASKVYSQNLDFSKIQILDGIKFIIQQDHYDDDKTRFCWDPYGFVSNGHSDISSIYRDGDWGTSCGGWIKIIDNDVILYFKSGDYGVYEDDIAIECAKKVFPTHKIHSFAGRQWDSELDSMFDSLPF